MNQELVCRKDFMCQFHHCENWYVINSFLSVQLSSIVPYRVTHIDDSYLLLCRLILGSSLNCRYAWPILVSNQTRRNCDTPHSLYSLPPTWERRGGQMNFLSKGQWRSQYILAQWCINLPELSWEIFVGSTSFPIVWWLKNTMTWCFHERKYKRISCFNATSVNVTRKFQVSSANVLLPQNVTETQYSNFKVTFYG